ncbi:hypothetical protein EV660_1179 [Roseinatronobacter bogoriensis DSM 18756]|nr:hypothetical protein [Rhodobaca bogoriensis DSM 18756]TDY65741.1 hypothetical protein EV660_1179 [Rhodobaca bogoriensis DSM 18756]
MAEHRCNACGKPKPHDHFRACPDCREGWRRANRKPGGPSETIEKLRSENARLKAKVARLESRYHDTPTGRAQ